MRNRLWVALLGLCLSYNGWSFPSAMHLYLEHCFQPKRPTVAPVVGDRGVIFVPSNAFIFLTSTPMSFNILFRLFCDVLCDSRCVCVCASGMGGQGFCIFAARSVFIFLENLAGQPGPPCWRLTGALGKQPERRNGKSKSQIHRSRKLHC